MSETSRTCGHVHCGRVEYVVRSPGWEWGISRSGTFARYVWGDLPSENRRWGKQGQTSRVQ